ncbi:DNA primase [Candidatus Micrarchaeota archaeon]|nr:DNA primase [Candidatus Micrarchaeota archaeon]
MRRYRLMRGLRYSRLGERRLFYEREFSWRPVARWFGRERDLDNTSFAVVIGRHSHVFAKKFAGSEKGALVIDDYSSLAEVKKKFAFFMPEGVYYDRNYYLDRAGCEKCTVNGKMRHLESCDNWLGQELAFDLDPENVECPAHGGLEEKMREHQTMGFCKWEFEEVEKQAGELWKLLSQRFRRVRVTYSGRGFHLHVFDYGVRRWGRSERKRLAKEYEDDYGIDDWITSGEMRLMRLPYSLHGMVSRIAVPLDQQELAGFNPLTDKTCIPRFLHQSEKKK